MTTINNIIDRIYRDYLTPPGEQPARFQVGSGGIDDNAATTTLPVNTAMLTAEQKDIIGVGRLIEGETGEMFLVEGVTGDPPTSLEVRREMYETTAQALAENKYLYLAGDNHKPRQGVFEAVQDAISGLGTRLWTVDVEETFSSVDPIELPEECAFVDNVEYASGNRYVDVQGWDFKRHFPHYSSGRALQLRGLAAGTLIHIYYRRLPSRPTAMTDDIADLYIEESWVKPIMVGAVAQVLANTDIDQSTIDFITEALEAQGYEIGQGADIRNSLLQFQDFLIGPLREAQTLDVDDRVVFDRSY